MKWILIALALAILVSCIPNPTPTPSCYTLTLYCGDYKQSILVRTHWTEMRPPNLLLICWVECGGESRGCTDCKYGVK
jgi:hypothetical protein